MGIHSRLDAQPALTLGASDVNLLELVNAYATVAADGREQEPVMVTKVVDRDGRVIYDEAKDGEHPRQALPYRSAFLMQKMLYLRKQWREELSLKMLLFRMWKIKNLYRILILM